MSGSKPDAELPAPLVEADTDISGLDGFMLDVQRLFASELWALSTGDEFKAALALWGRAWQQTPPGSLPDDDRLLAAFSGAGARWRKVRQMALRGFIKCSDGRLYHPVLCEDVRRAAFKREKFRERTKAATEARRKRNDDRNDSRDEQRDEQRDERRNGIDTTHATINVTSVQGQGQGHIEENTTPPPITDPAREVADAFLKLRLELWPCESRFPAPGLTLEAQARQWVEAGAPPELCIEHMRAVATKQAAANSTCPSSLNFICRSMEGVIARHLAAQQPISIANGHSNSYASNGTAWKPSDMPSDKMWRQYLTEYSRYGKQSWPRDEPPPDDVASRVPAHLLQEFGIKRIAR